MSPRTARLLALVRRHPQQFRRRFPEWLEKNRTTFDCFELAAISRNAGTSAKCIADSLRAGGRAINNDYVPGMARLYSLLHPEHNFFRSRN